MSAAPPLVTAILPVFNRAACVARAIESVLNQTYPAIELIIIDDGSSDGTTEIVERYCGAATILRQDNAGVYAARNLALQHARGDYVAFIDSDDAWFPGKITQQMRLMQPGIALVFGDIEIVSTPRDDVPASPHTGFAAVTPHRGNVLAALAWGNFVPTCTALVRRSALESIGHFDTSSRISADYLAWFRLAKQHRFDFVPDPVARYTIHDAGISFDLGQSLAARIALFGAERETERNPETRRILDRMLFVLGIHLAFAAIRGRARTLPQPYRIARRAVAFLDGHRALGAGAAFVARQLRLRIARLAA